MGFKLGFLGLVIERREELGLRENQKREREKKECV